ncbi:DUF3237 domain-containing protein [Pseudooceanicola sp. LIPI14-2-Ac024]|uniref:DUF3237 domain-containing protein n=1 Tax=Pseudooceanicola sp. LIPI14-2-Ac024 TaxID=3344875 RepID=UPI0035D07D51
MDKAFEDILRGQPLPGISTTLVWEALVDIGPHEALGRGPHGERGIIPITGGVFRGGPGHEDLKGTIVPGGADRQLLRADGAKELDAVYEMRVEDGTLLSLRNRVLIDETRDGDRYALSRIEVTAPAGRWDWLSRRIILGTLQAAMPARQAVVIRGWLADTD